MMIGNASSGRIIAVHHRPCSAMMTAGAEPLVKGISLEQAAAREGLAHR